MAGNTSQNFLASMFYTAAGIIYDTCLCCKFYGVSRRYLSTKRLLFYRRRFLISAQLAYYNCSMAKRVIALFGGTFDPIHLGHTTVAGEACKHIGAEQIVFVPAKRSPLKGFLPKAGDADRLKMIALAIADNEKFQLSDYELQRPAPSYTLQTVRHFQTEFGGETAIHWLLGADSIGDLAYWHRIVELIDQCNLSTMYRAGCEPPDFSRFESVWGRQRVEKLQRNIVPTSLIDISSTEIRRLLAAGRDVTAMLHPAVADYVYSHGLYRSKAKP